MESTAEVGAQFEPIGCGGNIRHCRGPESGRLFRTDSVFPYDTNRNLLI